MNARSTVKYASILWAMVVLLAGCIFEDDGTTGAPCSYFPMNTGNEWEFVSPGIDGITYTTKILSSSGRGSLFSDVSHIIPTGKTFSNFIVIDDRCRVYVYDKALRHKYKCLSFTDEMYQKWFVIYGDLAVTLESKNDTVTTPAGTFTGCFQFSCADLTLTDYGKSVWFAPGVGPVKISYPASGFEYLLKSARIDGKTVGE